MPTIHQAPHLEAAEGGVPTRTMYKQVLKKCCRGGETMSPTSSDDPSALESTASQALHDIIQSLDKDMDIFRNHMDKKAEITHFTSCLKKKLLHRWEEEWDQSTLRECAKVLVKQASDIANKRCNIEDLRNELRRLYNTLCAVETVVGMKTQVKNVMEELKRKHVVGVCGLVGIGKTKLLQCLEQEIRRGDAHLVAHVEVKQEKQNVEELQQSIMFQLDTKPAFPLVRPADPEHGRRQLAQCFRTLVGRGKKGVCLIVDGIRTKQFVRELLPPDMKEIFSHPSFLITSSRDKGVAHAFFELCCHDLHKESRKHLWTSLFFGRITNGTKRDWQ